MMYEINDIFENKYLHRDEVLIFKKDAKMTPMSQPIQ